MSTSAGIPAYASGISPSLKSVSGDFWASSLSESTLELIIYCSTGFTYSLKSVSSISLWTFSSSKAGFSMSPILEFEILSSQNGKKSGPSWAQIFESWNLALFFLYLRDFICVLWNFFVEQADFCFLPLGWMWRYSSLTMELFSTKTWVSLLIVFWNIEAVMIFAKPLLGFFFSFSCLVINLLLRIFFFLHKLAKNHHLPSLMVQPCLWRNSFPSERQDWWRRNAAPLDFTVGHQADRNTTSSDKKPKLRKEM